MCLSTYAAEYVWTYAGLCRGLRRHVCLHLNCDLYLNPNEKPFAALNRALFEKPFQKSFEKPNQALFPLLNG